MRDELFAMIKEHATASATAALEPVTDAAIEEAEAILGFKLPALLRLVYSKIGDGGFGPGYGLIGLRNNPSNLGTLVETHRQVMEGAKYLGLKWKIELLPFCDWGCNIFSCVDCSDSGPTMCLSKECNARRQDYTLEDFFNMWANGVSILDRDTAPRTAAEIINPFTHKKTRVHGER